jgi:hypothetical protein
MIHPAIRSLLSRRGPVCFGDFTPGQATPRPYDDMAIERAVREVLGFANRFAPPDRQYQTMEQVAADRSLFGGTLDKDADMTSYIDDLKAQANGAVSEISIESAKSELRNFRAQRDWVAAAIMTFRRFGYDGLADPALIRDSERYKSQY